SGCLRSVAAKRHHLIGSTERPLRIQEVGTIGNRLCVDPDTVANDIESAIGSIVCEQAPAHQNPIRVRNGHHPAVERLQDAYRGLAAGRHPRLGALEESARATPRSASWWQ